MSQWEVLTKTARAILSNRLGGPALFLVLRERWDVRENEEEEGGERGRPQSVSIHVPRKRSTEMLSWSDPSWGPLGASIKDQETCCIFTPKGHGQARSLVVVRFPRPHPGACGPLSPWWSCPRAPSAGRPLCDKLWAACNRGRGLRTGSRTGTAPPWCSPWPRGSFVAGGGEEGGKQGC